MSTGLSYEPRAEPARPRAAAKNCYTCFGEAWHAVRILATATCGGRRLGPVALFEGEGSDCSTTSITVARAAMAGARRSPAHGRVRPVGRSRHADAPCRRMARVRGHVDCSRHAPDAAPGAGALRGGVLYPIILALAQSAGSRPEDADKRRLGGYLIASPSTGCWRGCTARARFSRSTPTGLAGSARPVPSCSACTLSRVCPSSPRGRVSVELHISNTIDGR